MLLAFVIVILACLAMLLSFMSLKNDMKKGKHVEEVKKHLEKGRVIFYAPAHKSKQ